MSTDGMKDFLISLAIKSETAKRWAGGTDDERRRILAERHDLTEEEGTILMSNDSSTICKAVFNNQHSGCAGRVGSAVPLGGQVPE